MIQSQVTYERRQLELAWNDQIVEHGSSHANIKKSYAAQISMR